MIRGRLGRDHILVTGAGFSGREQCSQDICFQEGEPWELLRARYIDDYERVLATVCV